MNVSEGRVIVTGATRGIGRAVVDAIVGRGGRVVAVATNRAALDALVAVHGDRVRAVPADLGDTERIADVARTAIDAFGGVEGLVNCAGIARYEPVGAITPDSADVQLRVNLVAPMLLSQAVAEHLRDRGGAIVNVSSTLSERAAEFTSVYAATKAALNALTRGLALELAPHGIRVNAVLPGGVDTDMLRAPRLRPGESLDEAALARRVEHQLEALSALHPLGRLGRPDEVADVVVSVLDREWQTGSLVSIDGGLSLR
jgi:NAD(P)-dependent dehydrogenase (short-subunit alcohol dehydrogenase family)